MKNCALIVSFLLMSWSIPGARAGEVMTLDGKSAAGQISLADGAIKIQTGKGESLQIDPANILRAEFAPVHTLRRGLPLTSGEIIAIDAIQRLDDSGVHVTLHSGSVVVVPSDRVARMIFRPIPAALESHIAQGQAGVLLDSGDFFQGTVRDLNGDHVRADSVLFGVQTFDLTNQALAIVLHDVAIPKARWRVRDVQGSIFLADRIKSVEGKLSFDDAQLGAIAVPIDQLAEIEAGGASLQSLVDLKPIDAVTHSFRKDQTLAGVPMTLVGLTPQHGIAQRPGTTLSWRLDKSAQSFVATVGIPATLLPVGTVQFIVLLDGREIARSRALSSVDDPQQIVASVAGGTLLSLRVIAAKPIMGVEGLWADPSCAGR